MEKTIFKLEPFPRFLQRTLELNRLHSPEDDLHTALDGEATSKEAAWARKLLATIHKEFPEGAQVHEQAAFLVRAFGGLRPFSEANFRTGYDYTVGLLEHHGHPVMVSEDEARAMGADLWDRIEEAFPKGMPRGSALDRDDAFTFLADWFKPRIG